MCTTCACGVILYPIGESGQILLLADSVLAHFERYRQASPGSREAGGQLFARFDHLEIHLEHATGPRPTDYRSVTSFYPNRFVERREIRKYYKSGFHYVGDWHTHSELSPTPSHMDIASFQDMFSKSRHNLASFIMVIVGTAPLPAGLFVALCDDKGIHRLLSNTGNS